MYIYFSKKGLLWRLLGDTTNFFLPMRDSLGTHRDSRPELLTHKSENQTVNAYLSSLFITGIK